MKRRALIAGGTLFVAIGGTLGVMTQTRLWPKSGRTLRAEGQVGVHPHLRATLVCNRRLGRWVAELTLQNSSNALVAVTRYNLPADGKLGNNVFRFEGSATTVQFGGQYTKRGALTRGDCVELPAGGAVIAETVLDDWYALPAESVVVWYEAFHNPPDDEGTLWLVCSNKVELEA